MTLYASTIFRVCLVLVINMNVIDSARMLLQGFMLTSLHTRSRSSLHMEYI
jgi:hypothetical protein